MAISVTTDYTGNVERHPPVAWRQGFMLPRKFRATVSDTEKPYRVELWLSVHNGQVECDSVRISRRLKDGPPVTAREARLPLDRYIREAAVANAWKVEVGIDGKVSLVPMGSDEDDQGAGRESRRGRRKSPSKMTREHLEAVAKVYMANPKRPRQAIESDPRWAPAPPSTAARWIKAAKDAGLIGPSSETSVRKNTSRRTGGAK